MKSGIFRIIFCFVLTASILLGQLPAAWAEAETESTQESTISSETPEPEESVPDSSFPETSEPEFSEPEGSIPEVSKPESSTPETANPEESEPEEKEIEPSVPESSSPEAQEPELSKPEESELPEAETEQSEQISPERESPMADEAEISGPGLYFGLLHAHSSLSEGTAAPEEIFAAASEAENMDFLALTDHSYSFDHQELGAIGEDASAVSQFWTRGRAAAKAATDNGFVGLFGYEMSWPGSMQIGHISTFFTPGFQNWEQEPFCHFGSALENYYKALASVPDSVGQFNHPGAKYGTFSDFQYSEAADRSMALIEIDFSESRWFDRYIQALDQGWHLAPSGNQACRDSDWSCDDGVRTVIYAQSLTEVAIAQALRSRQAYATEDSDLEILYTLEDRVMGSRVDLRDAGEIIDISVSLTDPTDSVAGAVEVIADGGRCVARQELNAGFGTIHLSLPPEPGYYFLRITQPDGDTAVTAPVWVEKDEELGIAALTCETGFPVQNEEVILKLELYNRESVDFLVESLDFLADDQWAASGNLDKIKADSRASLTIPLQCDCVGITQIRAVLKGTLAGRPKTYEAEIQIRFSQSQQITAILVDASHENAGLDQLSVLKELAGEEHIDLRVSRQEPTAEDLENIRFLLVSAPSKPFSPGFLAAVSEYVMYGGSLVICGQGDSMDEKLHSAAELNRLIETAGSGMKIRDDLAVDEVNHGSGISHLYPEAINREVSWCSGILQEQVFRIHSGATVDPGSGTWMVRGFPTTLSSDGDGDGFGGADLSKPVLMACESLPGGGTVIVSGSLFFEDDSMKEPANPRDVPYGNRTLARALLGLGGDMIPLSDVEEARKGREKELFRVRGYVTAGTSNRHNAFPEMIYLQDDTGGIAVTPISGKRIQVGTPIEVTGYAGSQNGNRILKAESWKVLDGKKYRHQPKTGSWPRLLDPDRYGGSLVQAEGKCLEIYCREDDTLAGCLLEDQNGNRAKVWIEDYIGNGSDGRNELHKVIRRGRKVRAMGLLHVDTYGDAVLRVRNCEEVVFVPPKTMPGMNPKTGDAGIAPVLLPMAAAMSMLMLKTRKRL